MKHFVVSLDSKQLGNTIKRLNAYRDSLPEKLRLIQQKLAYLGKVKVETSYPASDAYAMYQGDRRYDVGVEPKENGFSIVLSGQAVAFIEFGAGVKYGDGYPGTKPAGIVPIGQYGKGHGQRQAWGFYNETNDVEITHGNPPAAVMYRTAQELREAVLMVAREVFAGD